MNKALLHQAIDTINYYALVCGEDDQDTPAKQTIQALKTELAKPEPEPTAWLHTLKTNGYQEADMHLANNTTMWTNEPALHKGTTMTQPRKHRHADMIRAWLDDDSLEVERQAGSGAWYEESTCVWHEDSEYRLKPKMIKCWNLEFPEPMRVAPNIGTEYWVADLSSSLLTYSFTWRGDRQDISNLARGICHTTKAAAEAHARALIALTESKS